MTTDEKQVENKGAAVIPPKGDVNAQATFQRGGTQHRDAGPRGGRGGRPPFNREKSEFDQKILDIRRVTRVVSGGRRMSFSVALVLGDKKGQVGLGTGKATDTSLAINKAVKNAKKNMFKIKTNKKGSLPYDIDAKFSGSRIMIMPNNSKGVVAGGSVRNIIVLAGLKDVTSKINSGSKNKLNIARATMLALQKLKV